MANTFKLIATVTAGSGGVSSMNFTDIPQTYTDLVILGSIRAAVDNTGVNLTFNSNTSSVYLYQILGNANNSAYAAKASATSNQNFPGANAGVSYTANIFSNFRIYIPDYTVSNNKYYMVDSVTENASNSYISSGILSCAANIGAAVSSIQLVPPSGTFDQHSVVSLYGISKS